MRTWCAIPVLAASLLPLAAAADEPPRIEHQQVPCTVPDKPFRLCTGASDDVKVEKVRVHFRRAGEKVYSYVEMSFGGLNYCATLPAPRAGKVKAIEYYVQVVDNQYQAERTNTYRLAVEPESRCEFAPVETDPERAKDIVPRWPGFPLAP